ncbi:MAG TPA: ATP-binding protein, partial [Solimonas sp.]|nr:ATP-binding protein [Solimonas sp.]
MSRSPARGRWFRDSSLQFKALTALGALMALFALTCLLFLRNQAHVREAAEWTAHTYDAIDHADNLMVHLVEQQNALRGYVVYKRADVKAQLQEAAEAFDRDYDRIQALTADNPTQQIRLHQVQRLMQAWRDEFAAAVSLAVETEPAGGRAEDLLRNGQGPRMIDAVRQELQHIIAEERRLLAGRNERLAQELTRIRWLALGMLVAGLALSALSVILIRRIVADPLTQLTGLIQRLRAGELEVEVPHQERGDELGEIARAIEGFRAASLDTQRSEWIKNHLNAVAVLMSQQHGYARFGEALLGYLCPALGVGQGALLRTTDDQMQTIASYGLVGEVAMDGLARQCLSSGRPITLDALPEDYVRIASATGAARARYLYLWPLPGLERPAGVLELASFAPLAARERELLAEVARLAGLALESLGNALRTRELLEETQAQSEELQASEEALRAQQEELRATNEALGVKNQALAEQGQRLRASEEELKVQAEELRTTNEELQERGRVLNEFNDRLQSFQKELEARNEDLQQASRYKSEFLANMSHELRTPLNNLLILSDQLSRNTEGNLNAKQVEFAKTIHASGNDLLMLINDILDLSKIESGTVAVEPSELRFDDLQRYVERTFRHVAETKKVDFRVALDPGLPRTMVTDIKRLQQIIKNLLSNAFKFTHVGHVSIAIAPAVSGWSQDNALHHAEHVIAFKVADTGIGISAEKQQIIFEAFQQADGSTSRKYGGTGLGLAISRELSRLLRGEIRLVSAPNKGSVFSLYLPQTFPASRAAPASGGAGAAAAAEAAAARSGGSRAGRGGAGGAVRQRGGRRPRRRAARRQGGADRRERPRLRQDPARCREAEGPEGR